LPRRSSVCSSDRGSLCALEADTSNPRTSTRVNAGSLPELQRAVRASQLQSLGQRLAPPRAADGAGRALASGSTRRLRFQGARMIRLALSLCLTLCSAALAQDSNSGPPQGGHPPRPPPEALRACDGKAAGASCSFSLGEHALEGTCWTPASDKPLACRPSGPPPDGR
jgi:hypothetical protein